MIDDQEALDGCFVLTQDSLAVLIEDSFGDRIQGIHVLEWELSI